MITAIGTCMSCLERKKLTGHGTLCDECLGELTLAACRPDRVPTRRCLCCREVKEIPKPPYDVCAECQAVTF